jgi:fructokinase
MKNITAIGEIIFDIYSGYKKAGGAPLNFIYHIQKLTGNGILISRVGNDPQGIEALEILRKNDIPFSYIQVDNLYETGIALANLDKNKIPHWKIPSERAYDFIDIPNDRDKIIENTMCLYFGSLAQRMEKSRTTIQSFFGKDIKYFFDINIRQNYYTKDILEKSLHAADVLKVNENEIYLLHNMFLQGKFELNQSLLTLMDKFNIELSALTLGNKGAWLFNNRESNFYKANVNDIIDTTGAGDAYSAMLCLGYLNNMGLNQINRMASDFAAELIKLPGAIPSEDTLYKKFKSVFNSSAQPYYNPP